MKIAYLIPEEELKSVIPLIYEDVQKCSADYRKADEKTLLFLLPGVNFDTYQLTEEYVNSSPFAIVTEDKSKFPDNFKNIIEVKNARRCFSIAMSRICDIN